MFLRYNELRRLIGTCEALDARGIVASVARNATRRSRSSRATGSGR